MTDERPTRAASLRIVDLVFGRAVPRPGRTLVVAAALALAAHGMIAVWAIFHAVAPPLAVPTPDRTIELAGPPPPPPPPPPAPTPLPPAPVTEPVRTPRPQVAKATPPAPAQAGKIIAQEPDPAGPVDLGDQGFVTGSGQTYAGGSTTSSGTNRQALTSPVVAAPQAPHVDRSSAVALLGESWTCPWPHEADDQDIDEEIVIVRVLVRADGTPVRARVVSDPGRGFGPAAVTCAEGTRYVPAHDADGLAIEATSPPIRVRFTR